MSIMEHNNFTKGRDSVLQALALMKDDEDFRRNYGNIPETISNRRETSVSVLCDMLVRLKRESDAKKQCIELLDDVANGWRLILEDREKMTETITDLKTERDELLRQVKSLEEEKLSILLDDGLRNKNTRDSELQRNLTSQSKDHDVLNKSYGAQWHISSVVDSFRKSTLEAQQDASTSDAKDDDQNSDENLGDSSRFKNSRSQIDFSRNESLGEPSQFSRMDYSTPRLTMNPYERLDSTYYNPTKFYQRQSSTFKRSGKKTPKGSKGGRKKSDAPETSTDVTPTKPTRGGKTGSWKKTPKLTVDLTVESLNDLPIDSDLGNTSPAPAKEDDEESPGTRYFDYTSTFLDETEHPMASP